MQLQKEMKSNQNSPAVRKVCGSQECCCEKDVKTKVVAKKWLWQ